MGIILWLVIGGVVGWLASIVMRRDGSTGVPMNIVVGIVGAMLGGWLIGPMVGSLFSHGLRYPGRASVLYRFAPG